MADSQQEAQHFLDYWRIVQSRKEIVIAVSLFVILAGVVLSCARICRTCLSNTVSSNRWYSVRDTIPIS